MYVCVSEIGKEKNDADVEEEVATGDSRFFLVISLLAIHHPIGVYLLSRHVGSWKMNIGELPLHLVSLFTLESSRQASLFIPYTKQ